MAQVQDADIKSFSRALVARFGARAEAIGQSQIDASLRDQPKVAAVWREISAEIRLSLGKGERETG